MCFTEWQTAYIIHVVLVLSNHLSLSTKIMLLMLHRCKTGYIKSNIVKHIALNCFIPINSWRVGNKHLAIKIKRYPRWSIHQVSTNYNIPEMIHRIGMRRLQDLQESGGVSSWTIPVQSIILHSFSLYEFTFQVLIKVFNEVVSTWDHMSYFLFSPSRFLRKYTRHIYCSLKLLWVFPFKVFSYDLSKRQ